MFLKTRRTHVGVAVAALVTAGFVALPQAASTPSSNEDKPDKPGRQEVALGQELKEAKASHGKKYESDVITTDTFDVAGITWDEADDADVEFSVRTRSDGQWSEWVELHGDDHAPDPGTREAKRARGGTDPLIAPNADAVELTVITDDDLPDDLQLDLVNSKVTSDDADETVPNVSTLAAEMTTTASAGLQPVIKTRKNWGADESIREPGNPDYGEIRGGFVHHTAGSNSYTREQVPGIIRGIYDYHVNGRGWRDIGYNFVVDRFGRTWEGRYGGMKRPVVGAHVSGYNSYSFGAAAMGTFTNHEPPSAVRNAFKRIFGWKFTLHGVDPKRSVQYPNGLKNLKTVSGHRNGGTTECPGDKLYDRLGSIRGGAAKLVQTGVPFVGIQDADRDGDSDLLARHSKGTLWLFGGHGDGNLGSRTQVGSSSNWDRITAFTAGDFTSDGSPDLIIRRDDGTLRLRRGNGSGGLQSGVQLGSSDTWHRFTAFADGDLNSDGNTDLLKRHKDGTMWLHRGSGSGGFSSAIQAGTRSTWHRYTAILGVGAFDAGNTHDLIARHKNGQLFLFRGNGDGTFRNRVAIGDGVNWNKYVGLIDIGEFTGDGNVDLLGRHNDGSLWLFPGTGNGDVAPRQRVGTSRGWQNYG